MQARRFPIQLMRGLSAIASVGAFAAPPALPGGFVGMAAAKAAEFDVPYVPTPEHVVRKMLDMAAVGPSDFVIDLGSGDGRILVAAARDRGARGLGVDIDPKRVREAHAIARLEGVSDRVSFRQQDLFSTSIRDATVVTLYLIPSVNLRLRPKLLTELRPGTRIVSHAFDLGDWEPDRMEESEGATLYHWIVPAEVGGRWRLTTGAGEPMEIQLDQKFQKVTGSGVGRDGRAVRITGVRLAGSRISFTADYGMGERLFVGEVDGARITPGPITSLQEVQAEGDWVMERLS